ncbi:MAG: beta-N-acetylhexosaminidase [Lewinellaceae bacterium]|nr:beta-N-acetylhexosaminidase [Lewinellaceae bacterium]
MASAMRNYQRTALFPALIFFFLMAMISCTSEPPTPKDLSKENLIPKPVSLTATGSSFRLTENTGIYVQTPSDGSNELTQLGQYLADLLKPATGFPLPVNATREAPSAGNIYLALSAGDAELGEEGYELEVTESLVKLSANTPAGLFRGLQTIRQLLPPAIESKKVQPGPWEIASGAIRDYPAYVHRGAMLDVSRHFFGVDDVKRYIDLLAFYKLNVLHLHLSDDQGWRIEIKSWPNLTAHGGSTEVGGGEGGYYTQEQYADIVQYAQARYITLIPEIDMPGHTNAALASYAVLNCDGKATELYTGIEVGFSTLCTDKDTTYKFIDDVIRELSALTPGPYIHIGGDESHVTRKDDYIYFINKVQDIVRSHGKQMIGWDEITLASLNPGSVAQFWANADNAKAAVEQGVKLIMSPAKKTYLDMQYDSTTALGLHWAAYVEVDSAYIWDPATYVKGVSKENILGVESPLWTETITNMDEIEYMAFPRLAGHAEIGWTPAAERNWEEYKVRLGRHEARFNAMRVAFYPSPLIPWEEEASGDQ